MAGGWRRLDRALHGYVYYVHYDGYVKVVLRLGRWLVKHFPRSRFLRTAYDYFFNRYHAKILREEDAKKFVTLHRDIHADPSIAEQIIPFKIANKIVLENPEYIAVTDCPCRLERNPAYLKEHNDLPVNVCLAIGKTIVNFWLEKIPQRHTRRITSEEALQIIADGHKKGWINTIWLKDATGGRTGILCNCSKWSCGGIEAMKLAGLLKRTGPKSPNILIPSGYAARLDEKKCIGCGTCVEVCPFDACKLNPDTQKAETVYDKCMGCGACVDFCKGEARELVLDPNKGIPLDLDKL